jgi:Oxaloacetate decarboxylase, gamma chain.
MQHALELMGLGLGGVFAALLILFIAVIIMSKVFPERENNEDGSK